MANKWKIDCYVYFKCLIVLLLREFSDADTWTDVGSHCPQIFALLFIRPKGEIKIRTRNVHAPGFGGIYIFGHFVSFCLYSNPNRNSVFLLLFSFFLCKSEIKSLFLSLEPWELPMEKTFGRWSPRIADRWSTSATTFTETYISNR